MPDITTENKPLSEFNATEDPAYVTHNAPIMLAEIDADLRYRFVNEPYAELFGKRPKDIIGKRLETVLSHRAFAQVKLQIKKAFKGESINYDLVLPSTNASGDQTTRILNVSYSPQINDEGNVTRFIAAVVDKTAEANALQEVNALNARLRAAHDLSLNGFVVIRAVRDDTNEIVDFSYIYANPKAEEIGEAKLVGHTLLGLFPGNKDSGLFEAYVNVVKTGEPYIKELYYEHDGLDFWLQISAIKLADGCALSFDDISVQKNSEVHNKLLVNELQHRVKNTLTTVQSMAAQTAQNSESVDEFSKKFQPRLLSISKAHDILLKSDNVRASLVTMINQQLRPYISMESGRLTLTGEDVLLSASSAQVVGLILHELTTNACKYGALSNDAGLVHIIWEQDGTNVHINWTETGGPPVTPPETRGFGSLLIEQSLKYGLGGHADLHFDPKGLKVDITLPVDSSL